MWGVCVCAGGGGRRDVGSVCMCVCVCVCVNVCVFEREREREGEKGEREIDAFSSPFLRAAKCHNRYTISLCHTAHRKALFASIGRRGLGISHYYYSCLFPRRG